MKLASVALLQVVDGVRCWLQNQSVPQKGVKEIQARIYELFVTVGLGTAAGFKANPNLMRTIIMQQHFGHFQDFVKVRLSHYHQVCHHCSCTCFCTSCAL